MCNFFHNSNYIQRDYFFFIWFLYYRLFDFKRHASSVKENEIKEKMQSWRKSIFKLIFHFYLSCIVYICKCIEYVHWRGEGCIGKYTPRGPRDFPKAGILHPEAREIARGRSQRAISRAEGCKINAEANLEVRGGRNFHYIPTLVSVMTFFFPRRGCFDFRFWPAHCVL